MCNMKFFVLLMIFFQQTLCIIWISFFFKKQDNCISSPPVGISAFNPTFKVESLRRQVPYRARTLLVSNQTIENFNFLNSVLFTQLFKVSQMNWKVDKRFLLLNPWSYSNALIYNFFHTTASSRYNRLLIEYLNTCVQYYLTIIGRLNQLYASLEDVSSKHVLRCFLIGLVYSIF